MYFAGGHIRFEAKSAGKAMEWVESIRQAIHEEQEREKQRVRTYLYVCVLFCTIHVMYCHISELTY